MAVYYPCYPQHAPVVYHIGENYKYLWDEKLFKLKSFNGRCFEFECGHWVTDCIMRSMVRVATGVSVWKEPIQLKLF